MILFDHAAGKINYHKKCFGLSVRFFGVIPDSEEMMHIARHFDNIFPNPQFATYMTKEILEPINVSDIQDGDYVIYFQENVPTHAGKVQNDSVVSKWGSGHKWKHGVWEVPSSYGTDVHHFKSLPKHTSVSIFIKWANFQKKKY